MRHYDVQLRRIDVHGSVAQCKEASVTVDSSTAGRVDPFNPAELLLAALGACMLKNIERVAPMLQFSYSGVHIMLHGEREDVPPRIERVVYRIVVDTDESEHRLALLHRNLQQFGTVYNTLANAATLEGTIEAASPHAGH